MIEKNEENTDNDDNLVRIKLLADKRKLLDDRSTQVQQEIKTCFANLAQALHAREKQLLRQAEAIYRQQVSLALSSQEFLPLAVAVLDEKDTLEEQIKHFGRIELRGSNSTVITDLEPYKIQEYQDTAKDHVSFDKSIKSEEINPSNAKLDISLIVDEGNIENIVSSAIETLNATDIMRKSNNSSNLQDEDSGESPGLSPKSNTESQGDDFDCKTATGDQQDGTSLKNSSKNFADERHNSCGRPEQVQQWLEQILLETEIEPTIHEVEQLPEITKAYTCTKLQVET